MNSPRFLFICLNVSEQGIVSGYSGGKEWGISFLRSPVEILPSSITGRVGSVRLEINTLKVNEHK